MDNSVVIKGSKNGITVVLDEELDFDELKRKVALKFQDSSKFLGETKAAVSFDGRTLSESEENQLVEIIRVYSKLDVVCVLNKDDERNKKFEQAVDTSISDYNSVNARLYRGNLRSGQSVEMETGVIILGDVNPGASVISNGNIIILGALKGMAYAGAGGNKDCFVIALDMNPMQIRIADVIARAPDKPDKSGHAPKVAYLDNGAICITEYSKDIVNLLTIN